MNIFEAAARDERVFELNFAEFGYKRFTTFVNDLVLAELVSGEYGIKDTYNRVMKHWISDIKYITEFVMSLNFLCNYRFQQHNDIYNLYGDLYYKAYDAVLEHYKSDQDGLNYFYKTID